MGVKLKLILFANSKRDADTAAERAIQRVEELEQVMSDYRPKSELNLLSDQSYQGFRTVSPQLHEIITASKQLSEVTAGAFDITVGPLVKLWRAARKRGALPSPDAIRRAQNKVGHHLLKIAPRRVCLEAKGMRLDMGGIGKGIGTDAALRSLREDGIHMALVELGGDLSLGDAPPGRAGWAIAIDLVHSQLLSLSHQGIATSGDAEQFVEVKGVRYSHIVDPETGVGLTNRCRVTVVAPDGTTADALASAVSVLGPKGGMKLIESLPDTEVAIWQIHADGTTAQHLSSGFASLLKGARLSKRHTDATPQ